MRVLVAVLVLLLLIQLNNCQFTTRTFDVFQQLENELAAKVQLVRKMVHLNYSITINPDNRWSQFPDMKIEFFLERPQFVNFDYKTTITTGDQGTGHMVTRLMIDGRENPLFRVIQATKFYDLTNQSSRKVWL